MNNNVERANFYHLVADVAWFGLALAATSRFLTIFAIRLGATPLDLGLLTALPGLVLLLSTGLSGWWRKRHANSIRAMILPSFGFRLVFLLPAFAPFFPKESQVMWLILAAALPAIPQGVAGAIFLTIMRESISDNLINRLNSRRTLALNICVAVAAVAFGVLLQVLPFPTNYQVMFVIAFLFTIVSMLHVLRVKILFPTVSAASSPVPDLPQVSHGRVWGVPSFQASAFITLVTHLAFFSVVAVVPLLLVKRFNADESFMAWFGLVELLAGAFISSFVDRIINKVGARPVIAVAMVGTMVATLTFMLAPSLPVTLIGAAVSGASWSAASVGVLGFFFQSMPSDCVQKGTIAYQQVVALGLFIGPMLGSTLANSGINLIVVLGIGAALRLSAAMLTYFELPTPARRRQLARN